MEQNLDGGEYLCEECDGGPVEDQGLGHAGDDAAPDSKLHESEAVDMLNVFPLLPIPTVHEAEGRSVEAVELPLFQRAGGPHFHGHDREVDEVREGQEERENDDPGQEPRGVGFLTRVETAILLQQVLVSLLQSEIKPLLDDPIIAGLELHKFHGRKKAVEAATEIFPTNCYVIHHNREEGCSDEEKYWEENSSQYF